MTKETTFSSSAGSCERQRTKSMWKKNVEERFCVFCAICERTSVKTGIKNFFQKKLCVLKNVVFLQRETKGVP